MLEGGWGMELQVLITIVIKIVVEGGGGDWGGNKGNGISYLVKKNCHQKMAAKFGNIFFMFLAPPPPPRN